MEQLTSLVLLRARLSDDDFRALKKAAIDEGKSNADFYGDILRGYLAEKEANRG